MLTTTIKKGIKLFKAIEILVHIFCKRCIRFYAKLPDYSLMLEQCWCIIRQFKRNWTVFVNFPIMIPSSTSFLSHRDRPNQSSNFLDKQKFSNCDTKVHKIQQNRSSDTRGKTLNKVTSSIFNIFVICVKSSTRWFPARKRFSSMSKV